MKMVKSLLLGSAAGLVAIAGAQAADLPVKAKPVEYVKVCSLYGAGFYYVPGTDTCVKIGTTLRIEYHVNSTGSDIHDTSGALAAKDRTAMYDTFHSRGVWTIDARTNSEYGVVRTYLSARMDVATGATTGTSASPTLSNAYIQFAGFTFGKATTIWDHPGGALLGAYTNTIAAGDTSTGFNQVTYTYNIGNGMSLSGSLVDGTSRRRGNVDVMDTLSVSAFTDSYGGHRSPDYLAQFKIDQAWGTFSVSGLLHQVSATYYGSLETTGWPASQWGWGVNTGITLKNLPTGAGDIAWLQGVYTKGATGWATGATTWTNVAVFGPGNGTSNHSLAFTYLMDGVFSSATNSNIELTTLYGAYAGFEHYWIPGKIRSSLFGSYTRINFSDQANAQLCSRFTFTPGSVCNFDTNYYVVGSRTGWTVIPGFDIYGQVTYSRWDVGHSGFVNLTSGTTVAAPKPTGSYELKDQGTWAFSTRLERSF